MAFDYTMQTSNINQDLRICGPRCASRIEKTRKMPEKGEKGRNFLAGIVASG